MTNPKSEECEGHLDGLQAEYEATREVMTLDDATLEFNLAPSDKVAARLLRTAAQYERDGMLEGDTFACIVERVAEWLTDE